MRRHHGKLTHRVSGRDRSHRCFICVPSVALAPTKGHDQSAGRRQLVVVGLLLLVMDKPIFNSAAGPGGFAQKGQGGFDTRIKLEAADGNALGHHRPTVPFDQLLENLLQRDAVQGIAGMTGR